MTSSLPTNIRRTNKTNSSSTKKKQAKRWTWSKPKDKPKRPLSAYNIFFKHVRSRIVIGLAGEGTDEEVVASVEAIFVDRMSNATTGKTTRSRKNSKSHHKVSFKNLASVVSEKWNTINPQRMALFQQYADLHKQHYFIELAAWKAKKETEKGTIFPDRRSSNSIIVTASTVSTTFLSSDSSSLADVDASESSSSIYLPDRYISKTGKELHNSSNPNNFDSSDTFKLERRPNPDQTRSKNNTTIANSSVYHSNTKRVLEIKDLELGTLDFSQPFNPIDEIIFDDDIDDIMDSTIELGMLDFSQPLNPIDEITFHNNIDDSMGGIMDGDDHDGDIDDSLDPAPLDEIRNSSKWFL